MLFHILFLQAFENRCTFGNYAFQFRLAAFRGCDGHFCDGQAGLRGRRRRWEGRESRLGGERLGKEGAVAGIKALRHRDTGPLAAWAQSPGFNYPKDFAACLSLLSLYSPLRRLTETSSSVTVFIQMPYEQGS